MVGDARSALEGVNSLQDLRAVVIRVHVAKKAPSWSARGVRDVNRELRGRCALLHLRTPQSVPLEVGCEASEKQRIPTISASEDMASEMALPRQAGLLQDPDRSAVLRVTGGCKPFEPQLVEAQPKEQSRNFCGVSLTQKAREMVYPNSPARSGALVVQTPRNQ